MNIYQYSHRYGRDAVERLAKACGTSYEYMRQLMYGYRSPGAKLLTKLVEESNGELDYRSLLSQRDWYLKRLKAGKTIAPERSSVRDKLQDAS